ncbi:MAG TPA: cell division protein FtsL [Nitrospiraceae bacterium]|jgi:cell division protein FtsL
MKLLTVFAGLALVFVFVWERVDTIRLGYQIERSKAQKLLLERERDQLQVRFSSLSAPERIAKVATERLGMMSPQQGQVVMVHVKSDGPRIVAPRSSEVRIAKNDVSRRMNE